MDLNNIDLPASLVAAIYKNHLIEGDQPAIVKKKPAKTTEKSGIQYLGKNQKSVCVLVNYANDVHLPDSQLNFLTSILQACKLNLGDVAIINCHKQKISLTSLTEQLSCKYLLLFGVDAASIGLEETVFFTIADTGSCQLVCSPAAEELNSASAESKSLKTKLWSCLKQLFAV